MLVRHLLGLRRNAGRSALAAPASVAGFTYVKSLGGFDEYRLDSNGSRSHLSGSFRAGLSRSW